MIIFGGIAMFKLNRKNGVSYYTITSFEKTGLVKHGFSTREGGVSDGCYSSFRPSSAAAAALTRPCSEKVGLMSAIREESNP